MDLRAYESELARPSPS